MKEKITKHIIKMTNRGSNTITYKNSFMECTLQTNFKNWERERTNDHITDIILRRVLAIDCPLLIYIQITTDGKITLVKTEWCNGDNTYWHVHDAPTEITDDQANTLALIFANAVCDDLINGDLPKQILSGLGSTPQNLLESRGGVGEVLNKLKVEIPFIC